MCYSPITIVNPTKYVSMRYRDRFLLRVPCGKCAQCQDNKKNEYYFRAFYHAKSCIDSHGFVLFDTLTYRPKDLPHISDYFPTRYNFPCFDSTHVRKFVARLRQRVKRKYKSNFEFMLTSEYGTSERHLHLPHYHILFFVNGEISPLDFSREVSDCWTYGRTDGIPYKSNWYVLNNVLNGDFAKSIRVLKYVTKYISKSCLFTKQINKRVSAMLFEVSKLYDDPDKWLDSLDAALFKEKLLRHIGQFHRQSTGFGLSYLSECDLNTVFNTGRLTVKDNERIILSIPVPTYYKRKLFYEQCEVDGTLVWVPTDYGEEYLKQQSLNLKKTLKLRYSAASLNVSRKFNVDELVNYLVDERGRIKADLPQSTFYDRLKNVDFYKYATRYDRRELGQLGLVREFLGNSQIGYKTARMPKHIPLFSFGKRFVFYDKEKESLLDYIDYCYSCIDADRQRAYELRQRLTNLYHHYNL